MNSPTIERINVNFSRPVLDDLRRLVPAKRRSEVIARTTTRELRRLKVAALFENLERNPAWQAESYPNLADGATIDRFVAELRTAGTPHPPTISLSPTRRKARRE